MRPLHRRGEGALPHPQLLSEQYLEILHMVTAECVITLGGLQSLIQLAAALNLAVLLLSALPAPFLKRGRINMESAIALRDALFRTLPEARVVALREASDTLNWMNQRLYAAEEQLLRREDMLRIASAAAFLLSVVALVATTWFAASQVAAAPFVLGATTLLGPAVIYVAVLLRTGTRVRQIERARDAAQRTLDPPLPTAAPWVGLRRRQAG